jgi:MraZ protein
VWEGKQEELLRLRRSGVEGQHYVRKLLSMAVEVSPDKQGRILVPAWLKEAASLEDTVLMSGNIDRVELWNPELFEEQEVAGDREEVTALAGTILR